MTDLNEFKISIEGDMIKKIRNTSDLKIDKEKYDTTISALK